MASEPTESWSTTGADLILRSEDGVELRVHKLMLVHAFQGFEDMLSGTPLLGTDDTQELKNDLQVVALPDKSVVLKKLLELTYPVAPPELIPKAVLLEICTALDKYCVKSYPRPVVERLLFWAEKEPAHSYIRACRFRLREVAVAAMKASLRSPKLFAGILPAELSFSAEQYHAFVTYQMDCRKEAIAAAQDLNWMCMQKPLPPGYFLLGGGPKVQARRCATCHRTPFHTAVYKKIAGPGLLDVAVTVHLSTWLNHYLDAVQNALAKETTGTVATNQKLIRGTFNSTTVVICDDCKTADNALGMVAFAEKLKKEIDKRIATVEISVPGLV